METAGDNNPAVVAQELPQQPPNGGEAQPQSPTSAPIDQSRDQEEGLVTMADFSLMNKYIRTSLLKTTNDVEVIRNDPTSPLYSVKSFEELNLDNQLLRGIYDMGFSKPSKIQETVLPLIITERKNMIAQSQSGTGKTAAFVLSSLSRVDTQLKYPQVIILSPTLELANQTYAVAAQMAKFKPDITFKRVVKNDKDKMPIMNGQWTETVLIGTPGKLIDSAFKFKNFDMKKIKVFVLDEADVMIDAQGHKKQSLQMRRALPDDCQILLFSATYNEEVKKFAVAVVPNAVEIHLKREEQSLSNISQYYVVTRTEDDKYRALANIFGSLSIGQAFIFCQTKKSARYLEQKLSQDGHKVGLITGDLLVEQRNQTLLDFKEGRQRVLISTNLMARGIDIDQVTVVVNYDLPLDLNRQIDKETYLHRIGRTGRFGKNGFAFNFISSMEEKRMIETLQSYFKQPITELNTQNFDELEKLEQQNQ